MCSTSQNWSFGDNEPLRCPRKQNIKVLEGFLGRKNTGTCSTGIQNRDVWNFKQFYNRNRQLNHTEKCLYAPLWSSRRNWNGRYRKILKPKCLSLWFRLMLNFNMDFYLKFRPLKSFIRHSEQLRWSPNLFLGRSAT